MYVYNVSFWKRLCSRNPASMPFIMHVALRGTSFENHTRASISMIARHHLKPATAVYKEQVINLSTSQIRTFNHGSRTVHPPLGHPW
jgi:hypothetical protein